MFYSTTFYLFFFIIILVLSRIIPHPPNFTPILATAIIAPSIIKDRNLGILIPLLAMFTSDLFIGFHSYQLVVYFSILCIGILTPLNKNYKNFFFMAILGSIWFYITTNFAVWLIWDYYPKSFEGLVNCYYLALPFFRNTIVSTILFTTLYVLSTKYIIFLNTKFVDIQFLKK